MTYTATLYYTETKTKTAQVEANNRNEAHDKLKQRKELVGFECYTLERVK